MPKPTNSRQRRSSPSTFDGVPAGSGVSAPAPVTESQALSRTWIRTNASLAALLNEKGLAIGETTFGKGSVQVLYDNYDGSALKLTIAQYLTPGDISIQTSGITPDVQLLLNPPNNPDHDRIWVYGIRARLAL